jgi:disulfide bond formation protein DsbB
MQVARVNSQMNWVNQAANPVRLIALVLCLLLSQALGFMHGIEHAPHSQHLHHKDNHSYQTQFEAKASNAHASWLSDLFAGHSDESTCQVFDQLSHGSALLGSAVEFPKLTLSSFFLDTYRGATPHCQRSLIQARGPPAISPVV